MKARLLVLLLLPALLGGCRKEPPETNGDGFLKITLGVDAQATALSKSTRAAPTAAELTLEILRAGNRVSHFSPVGTDAKTVPLSAGDYTVKAYSALFTAPAFDCPVYAAQTAVSLATGATSPVSLTCTQSNAGVCITYSAAFQAAHTTYHASITQDGQTLSFTGADAARTGYFAPGNVTLTLTVDGVVYNEQIALLARRLYTLEVKDQPVAGGTLGISLAIDTHVTDEYREIVFPPGGSGSGGGDDPQRQVIYSESMGTGSVGTGVAIGSYTHWLASGITYDGTGMLVVLPQDPSSGYTGASGSNAVLFNWANRAFTLDGINTAGYSSLQLALGASIDEGGSLLSTHLSVEASTDGTNFSPLTHTLTPGGRWSLCEVAAGIPATARLRLRITSKTAYLLIDDLSLSGITGGGF